MSATILRRVLWVLAILALPVIGHAQEALLTGTVTDSTGAVLPGVTVRAVHAASGNSFEAVTDERGAFRIAVRTGSYQLTADLVGFGTVTRTVELLVGQQGVLNVQMSPVGVQESVTVTGEAPLIDFSASNLGGNIDPRQMEDLPVNGRNWQDLVMLAPGSRTNDVGNAPTAGSREGLNDFQLHMDGQEVTNNQCCRGQPSFSKDSIAEFQFLSSRFDATQGRSSGVQVNVVTKSGTNTPGGSFSGYFRDSKFKAADFFAKKVIPYEDQQVSATFGGPILRDRLHYFGHYEREREPQTFTFATPWPLFNVLLTGTRSQWMGGVRFDYQLSERTRLMMRGNASSEARPYEAANNHPAASEEFFRHNDNLFASLTQVLSNRALNEIKAGYEVFYYYNNNNTIWANHPQAFNGITRGSPRVTFTGYVITGNPQAPQGSNETKYSIRDDFTFSFTKWGRHDMKVGGEYIHMWQSSRNCRNCMGIIDATGGPIPANIEELFPVWNDASTWNLAALSPIVKSYTLGVGKFKYYFTRDMPNAWLQDDWAITSKLTLNLGVRYELIGNAWANSVEFLPWLTKDRPDELDNLAPRLGFAYTVNDRTVVRGGFGQYFGYPVHNVMSFTYSHSNIANVQILNDGRADFAANPFNGPIPSYERLAASACSVNNVPGCVRKGGITQLAPPAQLGQIPYSWQTSIGLERQIGSTMSFSADYAYIGGRRAREDTPNVNIAYDPATGINYNFNDLSKRPFPEWGSVAMANMAGETNYHGLETGFTKRMSHRWQGSATYTLSALRERDPQPLSGLERVTFTLAEDLGGAYGLGATDQRHRAVFNGIYQVGYGFQLSGLYFFGSGQRFSTSYGGDRRNLGVTSGQNRLRPNGTISPRNALVGRPIHRVDLRVQRRFRLAGRVGIDGILEVFNLFNHENYGSYTTAESNRNYRLPTPNTNVSYSTRMLQFGFRATF